MAARPRVPTSNPKRITDDDGQMMAHFIRDCNDECSYGSGLSDFGTGTSTVPATGYKMRFGRAETY